MEVSVPEDSEYSALRVRGTASKLPVTPVAVDAAPRTIAGSGFRGGLRPLQVTDSNAVPPPDSADRAPEDGASDDGMDVPTSDEDDDFGLDAMMADGGQLLGPKTPTSARPRSGLSRRSRSSGGLRKSKTPGSRKRRAKRGSQDTVASSLDWTAALPSGDRARGRKGLKKGLSRTGGGGGLSRHFSRRELRDPAMSRQSLRASDRTNSFFAKDVPLTPPVTPLNRFQDMEGRRAIRLEELAEEYLAPVPTPSFRKNQHDPFNDVGEEPPRPMSGMETHMLRPQTSALLIRATSTGTLRHARVAVRENDRVWSSKGERCIVHSLPSRSLAQRKREALAKKGITLEELIVHRPPHIEPIWHRPTSSARFKSAFGSLFVVENEFEKDPLAETV